MFPSIIFHLSSHTSSRLSRVFQTSFLPRNTSQLLLGRRSPGIPRTDEIHNLTTGLWVYPRVSSQLGVPRKPTKGSTQEASCVAGKLLRASARYPKSSSVFEPSLMQPNPASALCKSPESPLIFDVWWKIRNGCCDLFKQQRHKQSLCTSNFKVSI